MNLQIETLTLANGDKVDVIRDVEKVRKLLQSATDLRAFLESSPNIMSGFDVPDEIWVPFTHAIDGDYNRAARGWRSGSGPSAGQCDDILGRPHYNA